MSLRFLFSATTLVIALLLALLSLSNHRGGVVLAQNTTATTASTAAAPTTSTTTQTTTATTAPPDPAGPVPNTHSYINPNVTGKVVISNGGAPVMPHLEASNGGSIVLIVFCVVILIVTLVAVLIYRKNWQTNVEEKRKKDQLKKLARDQNEVDLMHAVQNDAGSIQGGGNGNNNNARAGTGDDAAIRPVEMDQLQLPNQAPPSAKNDLDMVLLDGTGSGGGPAPPPQPTRSALDVTNANPASADALYKGPEQSSASAVNAAPQVVNPATAEQLLAYDDEL